MHNRRSRWLGVAVLGAAGTRTRRVHNAARNAVSVAVGSSVSCAGSRCRLSSLRSLRTRARRAHALSAGATPPFCVLAKRAAWAGAAETRYAKQQRRRIQQEQKRERERQRLRLRIQQRAPDHTQEHAGV